LVSLINYPKRHLRKLVHEAEYVEALQFGKSLEKKHSKDTDLFFIIASIYYMIGDAKNTISYLDKVLAIKENDMESLLMKADVSIHLKNKEKALDCYEKIRKIDPKNKAVDEILDKLEKI